MPTSLAKIISILFQPLLMTTYGVLLLLSADTWMSYMIFPQLRYALYMVVVGATFLLPALTVLMFLKKGIITSLEMRIREERNWPYLITLLFYAGGWYLLNKLPLPRLFGNMIMGAGLAILLAYLINLRWKISIHMIGLGGLAGMLFAISTLFQFDLTIPVTIIVAIAGITGSARLALHAHTPSQVYTGFLFGFCVEWVFVYIYNVFPYSS